MDTKTNPFLGVVIIGRNEGERLRLCLESVTKQASLVVYVDSGSRDNSVELVKSAGISCVVLDENLPFTAARARNNGVKYFQEHYPKIKYVQFLDGDCELVEGWLGKALDALVGNSDIAIVCGRRRERFPDSSIYNQLCDIEWNTPAGDAKSCGGDSMVRVEALLQAKGFNETLIAGEEPELCFRLRQRGWKILRLNEEMTLHDAAILRLDQWNKRLVRSGYAYAEAAMLHGRSAEHYGIRESVSIWFWSLIVPILIFTAVLNMGTPALWFFLLYVLLGVRIFFNVFNHQTNIHADAALYAIFCVLGKFPQMLGQIRFLIGYLCNKSSKIIEYKGTWKG